jgi:hypothetical protein
MVGDYISTSFVGGAAFPVIAVASAPVAGVFNEAMFTTTQGLRVTGGALTASSQGAATSNSSTGSLSPTIR